MNKYYRNITLLTFSVFLIFFVKFEFTNAYTQSSYYSQPYYQSYYQGTYTTLEGVVGFSGNLSITDSLSKGSGTFVIDHPLDPKNKLLYHSFVESPDVKNIYDGVAELDKNGTVKVQLPDYFEALNDNFRYQFLPLKEPMPNLYVLREVSDNSFVIAGGAPNGRISWQVTGIRKDPYILENPIINEVEKGPDELVNKGEYLFERYETLNSLTAGERVSLFYIVNKWIRGLFN